MQLIRIEVTSDARGVCLFQYGEVGIPDGERITLPHGEYLEWESLDFSAKFGLFSEIGQPYVPMFECLLAMNRVEVVSYLNEQEDYEYLLSAVDEDDDDIVRNAHYEMIFFVK